MQRRISAVDPALLWQATEQGQATRQALLDGAVIVFALVSYSAKKWILERAAQLGVRCIVLDGPKSWAAELAAAGSIERFVPIDVRDTDNAFDACRAAISSLQQELGSIDAICSFAEAGTPLAAALAESFRLPSNPAAAVLRTCNKAAMRKHLAAAGLPTPRNFPVTSAEHLQEAARHVGFPAVLKPALGSGSDNVARINSMAELQDMYARLRVEALQAQKAESSGKQADANEQQPVMLLEEFLDGPEVDVELVLCGGRPVYAAVVDSWGVMEPYFMETGTNIPSALPQRQQAELLQCAVRSVQALGLTQGAIDVEMRLTPRGPRIIEVNARMAGGPFRLMNLLIWGVELLEDPLLAVCAIPIPKYTADASCDMLPFEVWGVDLLEEHLLAMCGIPNAPLVAAAPRTYLGQLSVNAPCSGTLQHDGFLEAWATHPDVVYAHPLVAPGGRVTAACDGQPTFVGEVLVAKPTLEDAIGFASEIQASLDVPVE